MIHLVAMQVRAAAAAGVRDALAQHGDHGVEVFAAQLAVRLHRGGDLGVARQALFDEPRNRPQLSSPEVVLLQRGRQHGDGHELRGIGLGGGDRELGPGGGIEDELRFGRER